MCINIRSEEDLLGKKNISNNVYYGIHTLRAIDNFSISNQTINNIPELIRGMIMVKKAVAITNKELKVLPEIQANIIIQACDEILYKNKYMNQFPIDVFQGGAGTSLNMNINEVLANIGLELMGYQKGQYKYLHPNDHVNKSQSTNDVYPTGLKIAIYNSMSQLIDVIKSLKNCFNTKANKFKNILKIGRTQLQDAVPMTVGQEFYAFSHSLKEGIKNIHDANKLLLKVNLGATAIGTGINTVQNYQKIVVKKLSEVTKLYCIPTENLISATSDCTCFITVHAGLKRLALILLKICNDLRLLSSGPRAGLKEINLPELQAGSSIMPAKINPVIPEVVNQTCFKVIGNDLCVTMAVEAGELQLNVMGPVISQSIFESIKLMNNACYSLLTKCIRGITVNKDICKNYVTNSIGIITYLIPYIGHHNGDMIGKICTKTGMNVKEVVIKHGLLTQKQLDEIFSLKNFKNSQYKL